MAEAGADVCRRLCVAITAPSAKTTLADTALFIEEVQALGARVALDDAAVRCFIYVARVLGVNTAAELVDHQKVCERVCFIGIDCVQGFSLHRPEPIENGLSAQAGTGQPC